MPQRFLRPGINHSLRWNKVSHSAGNFFIRLLTLVDDFGRCNGRPSVLLGYCYSVWNELNPKQSVKLQQVAGMLQQLAAENLIDWYEIDGKQVVQISQWQERIRENSKSKWPAFTEVAASCSKLQPSSSPPTPSPTPSPVSANAGAGFPKELASQSFKKSWDDWEQHRKEIKKPLTPTQREAQLSHLSQIGEERAIAAIKHTIFKGWQGIKEPEQNNGTRTHQSGNAESRRNVGTANEGRSSQYAGVGKSD